jgi:hypothetical protein
MKVEKNRILLFSWLPTGTSHENLANLGQFFQENPLYKLKSYFSGRNLTKFRQKKNPPH